MYASARRSTMTLKFYPLTSKFETFIRVPNCTNTASLVKIRLVLFKISRQQFGTHAWCTGARYGTNRDYASSHCSLHGFGLSESLLSRISSFFAAFKESVTLNFPQRLIKVIHLVAIKSRCTTLYRPSIVNFRSCRVSEILPVFTSKANFSIPHSYSG